MPALIAAARGESRQRLIFLPALRKMTAFYRFFRDHAPASQVALECGMTPKAVQRMTDETRRQLGMTRETRRRRREIPAEVFEALEKDSRGQSFSVRARPGRRSRVRD